MQFCEACLRTGNRRHRSCVTSYESHVDEMAARPTQRKFRFRLFSTQQAISEVSEARLVVQTSTSGHGARGDRCSGRALTPARVPLRTTQTSKRSYAGVMGNGRKKNDSGDLMMDICSWRYFYAEILLDHQKCRWSAVTELQKRV